MVIEFRLMWADCRNRNEKLGGLLCIEGDRWLGRHHSCACGGAEANVFQGSPISESFPSPGHLAPAVLRYATETI